MNETPTVLPSRQATEEEQFYLKLAREEFAASLSRIEETAKYLIGAVGAVAGLLLSALQIKIAVNANALQTRLTWAFLLWGASALLAILVIMPLPYHHFHNSPPAIRASFKKARWLKWSLLLLSTLAFGAGLLLAVVQF